VVSTGQTLDACVGGYTEYSGVILLNPSRGLRGLVEESVERDGLGNLDTSRTGRNLWKGRVGKVKNTTRTSRRMDVRESNGKGESH
jgi:hypothetical protein